MNGSKTYRGVRSERGVEVWVLDSKGGHLMDPHKSLKLANHSPSGWEWGYEGSGPAQLALAILLDATGNAEFALDNYQDFKRRVVALLSWGGWTLATEDLLAFAATAKMEVAP